MLYFINNIILDSEVKDRNPSVPSLYFIGRNGSPIKIVTEAVDATALLEHISHVENVHFAKSESNEAASSQTTVASCK